MELACVCGNVRVGRRASCVDGTRGRVLAGRRAVLAVAAVATLLACSGGGRPASVEQYRVSAGEGFLVVAHHVQWISSMIDLDTKDVGCEVKLSGPGGEFQLTRPGVRKGEVKTNLLVSKPGFGVHIDSAVPHVPDIELAPTRSYKEEALAVHLATKYLGVSCLDAQQARVVREHIAARRAYLEKHYRADVLATERRLAANPFRRLAGVSGPVLAAAALAKGAIAVATRGKLTFLDGQQRAIGEITLSAPAASAALAARAELIAIVDGNQVRRFDFTGKPLASISLNPDPSADSWVVSLALGEDAYLLGVHRMEPRGLPQLRRYTDLGKQVQTRDLPLLRLIYRVFLAPDGAVLVYGDLADGNVQHLHVAGLKKRMNRGNRTVILRLSSWSAEPEVAFVGPDDVVATGDGLLAYFEDLYPPEDIALVANGVSGFTQDLLLDLSWTGKVVSARDASHAATSGLRLAEPSGDRLVFYSGSSPGAPRGDGFLELDLGKLERVTTRTDGWSDRGPQRAPR